MINNFIRYNLNRKTFHLFSLIFLLLIITVGFIYFSVIPSGNTLKNITVLQLNVLELPKKVTYILSTLKVKYSRKLKQFLSRLKRVLGLVIILKLALFLYYYSPIPRVLISYIMRL